MRAEYTLHAEYIYNASGDPVYQYPGGPQLTYAVFGIPGDDPHLGQFNSQGPIGLGLTPGGIAVMGTPAPLPIVYKQVADQVGSGIPGAIPYSGVELTPTQKVVFPATDVDPITGNVETEGGNFYFSINVTSKVTLYLKGDPDPSNKDAPPPVQDKGSVVESVPDPTNPNNDLPEFKDVILSPGIYSTVITSINLSPLYTIYSYTLQATAYDPDTNQTTGAPGTAQGLIVNQLADFEACAHRSYYYRRRGYLERPSDRLHRRHRHTGPGARAGF